jgi:hypothetical protein
MQRYAIFALDGGGLAVIDTTDGTRFLDHARAYRFVGLFDRVEGRTLEDFEHEAERQREEGPRFG